MNSLEYLASKQWLKMEVKQKLNSTSLITMNENYSSVTIQIKIKMEFNDAFREVIEFKNSK